MTYISFSAALPVFLLFKDTIVSMTAHTRIIKTSTPHVAPTIIGMESFWFCTELPDIVVEIEVVGINLSSVVLMKPLGHSPLENPTRNCESIWVIDSV